MSLFINTSNSLGHHLLECSNDENVSISETIERDCLSVLHKLHDQVNGLQLVQVVVQPLARLFNPLSSTTSTYMMSPDTSQALIARLDTDRDVNWLMEIIGYGLSMPFSVSGEQDSVKDCCTIYCEWLTSALIPIAGDDATNDSNKHQPSKLVPEPIRKDPNRYARKMFSHLYNVFLPRQPVMSTTGISNQKEHADQILTAASRQAVLCHRVLRTIENIAQDSSNLMHNDTWHHLLALLLTVNDKLLSVPSRPDDTGTQLHDRILGVLFDLIVIASSRSIPDANFWRTFHSMCLGWRHGSALVDHWRRISKLLTKRIVYMSAQKTNSDVTTSNPNECNRNTESRGSLTSTSTQQSMQQNAIEILISQMNYENLSQTWYRFLNLIGNPVELSDPSIISKTDEFFNSACVENNVLDPRQHLCLTMLPQIFSSAMSGIRELVELFIGTHQTAGALARRSSLGEAQQVPTPQSLSYSDRPKCNSLLHIFGDWLFSSALIGSDLTQNIDDRSTDGRDANNMSESVASFTSSTTATETLPPPTNASPAFRRRQSHVSTASSHASTTTSRHRSSKQFDNFSSSSERIIFDQPLTAESFELGQAEAMSILCKLFSFKSASEDISPVYLARFYLCIQHCLSYGCIQDSRSASQPISVKRQLLASVMVNATDLLQKDLDGINLLIPSFIKAIELVFESGERDTPVHPPPRQNSRTASVRHANSSAASNISASNVTGYDLRRACIITLVNLLAYPFHFQDLAIRSCLDRASPVTTFGSLRPRLLRLLFIALQTEEDSTNMQILFGGLSLVIHDLASDSNKILNHDPESDPRARITIKTCSPHTHRNDNIQSSLDVDQPHEDTISQSSFVYDSNEGFLIKSLHVTCHLLINVWKHDNLVSLAALELLTTIARVTAATTIGVTNAHISRPDKMDNNDNNLNIEMKNEYTQTTKWICDYICNQCSRPPPAHSRDMHSTIVAAYQCLSIWLYNHPYLLHDSNCVNTLTEVIELGVSGQKSRTMSMNPAVGVATQTFISKGEKLMKPSSMRVREAAESLLNICMVRNSLSGQRNISLCDTIIGELDIAEMFGGLPHKTSLRHAHDAQERDLEACKFFKYFSDEDSMIFALFEGQNQDPVTRDSVFCLIRTPFGKHCWKLNFNYYTDKTRDKIVANKAQTLLKRCEVKSASVSKGQNKSIYFNKSARYFPESIENLSLSHLDQLVATLKDYFDGKYTRSKNELEKMNAIFSHQVSAEQKVTNDCSLRSSRVDCEEPQPVDDLETARLIVTHLGLQTSLRSLSIAEKISPSFITHLRTLDNQPLRSCDTVNVFYVRRNRISPLEILESVRERHNISVEFFKWLLELGEPVVVKEHHRWNGLTYGLSSNAASFVAGENCETLTSTKSSQRNQMLISDHGGAIFDGERMTLYWSDMCQELAFVVPHRVAKTWASISIYWLECSDDLANVPCESFSCASHIPLNVGTLDEGTPTSFNNLSGAEQHHSTNSATPTSSNKSQSKQQRKEDFARYFISPMKNGLYRVNIITSLNRSWLALPLVDGMTISKVMLSSLIRESVLNLCRRRCLDADSHQPPHVKRRLKIQEICNNFKISSRSESSEFYKNMFRHKTSTTV